MSPHTAAAARNRVSMRPPMRITKSRKSREGSIWIIRDSAGSSQFSLPGKISRWNAVQKLSKLMAAQVPPKATSTKNRPRAQKYPMQALRRASFPSKTTPPRHSTMPRSNPTFRAPTNHCHRSRTSRMCTISMSRSNMRTCCPFTVTSRSMVSGPPFI